MNRRFFFLFLTSLFLVAFGQPSWSPLAGIFSSLFGFALFWRSTFYLSKKRDRFWAAVIWFAAVEGVQLSWMTSIDHIGPLILPVYILLLFGLGLQFGFLSLFLSFEPIPFRRCLGISGCWVLFEWIRIFLFSGFTWNPVGLALSSSSYAIQFASLFGVYGLSFWVMLINLAAFNAFFTFKNKIVWGIVAAIPFGFGLAHEKWVESYYKESAKNLSVALLETNLSVEKRYGDQEFSPLDQWQKILSYLAPEAKLDLIVLPEGAFLEPAYHPYFFLEEIEAIWTAHFGKKALLKFPPLTPPLAFPYQKNGKIHYKVSHAFLSQALSNYFQGQVIIGLNDDAGFSKYNAAFCFHPDERDPERHIKRVLAPVGEYIPLSHIGWISRFIEKHFGIYNSFDRGKKATVFSGAIPIGAAICLEEIYSGLIRELRRNGAELLISLSDDGWFPSSHLAQQHFDHGRIRSVENGVYLLRSSNMGVTGGVDCLGRPFTCLIPPQLEGRALHLSLGVYSYPTLYSWWGNAAILFLSLSFLLLSCRKSCP